MESCIASFAAIAWTPVLVSTGIAFLLGWLWYSDKMFLAQWQAGIGAPVWQAPLWMPMAVQLFSTLILAVITHISLAQGHLGFVFLSALMLVGFIKSNGLYAGKTKTAIAIEVGYIVVMVLIMVGVNLVL